MVVLKFFRRPAQSSGAHEVSLGKISSVVGKNRIKYLDTEICFYVLVECEEISVADEEKFLWVFMTPFQAASIKRHSFFQEEPQQSSHLLEIGPRLNFSTPFSTNAVSICHSIGLKYVSRIEYSVRYLLKSCGNGLEFSTDEINKIASLLHDRMTQCIYAKPIDNFDPNVTTDPVFEVDVQGEGRLAMERINKKLGLAFDDWDLEYYCKLFKEKIGRNPTSIECFDLAQSNSEHSRHWFFKGRLVVDGEEHKQSLFEMVMDTHRFSNGNNVIKFSDNSSGIEGFAVKVLVPSSHAAPSPLVMKDGCQRHIIFTAETHNFPTGVAPFPGATTGTGGRIRDIHCTGKGAHVVAGTAGYSFGNLNIPGYHLPWEDDQFQYPNNFAQPVEVAVEASNGASDYGNKFGEPVLAGFARSFGLQLPTGERREFVKPIMFSGGVGMLEGSHVRKAKAEKGMKVVKVGGPAYRIGVGGGAASSVEVQGNNRSELDFRAVQRGDAEMEQKLNRVIRACVELFDRNPICSIHDQGSGGNGNVLKEIVEPAGAIIHAKNFQLADPTLSILELWGAEYQESNALLTHPENEKLLSEIGQRERCPVCFVGSVTGDAKIRLEDFAETNSAECGSGRLYPVDLELEHVLGSMPRKVFKLDRVKVELPQLKLPDALTVRAALDRVLRLPSVASKRYLTNKVDRSVTGLVAQQQCVGPLHTPLADVAVTALTYFDTVGSATAIGEQPVKGLVDPCCGARMSVGEALTNLVFARITALEDVKCSGNWMWPAKLPGEGVGLFDACKAMCSVMETLGIAVDGGKDSLSMAARVGSETVKAPGTLVVSVYAPCPDITATVTPDLKCLNGKGILIYVDASKGKRRTGGTALAQCYGQIGNESPDLDNPDTVKNMFVVTQKLIIERKILAGHDVSDGGIITCLLEMAFAGNCGISVDLPGVKNVSAVENLFSEELGLMLEVNNTDVAAVLKVYRDAGLVCHEIGQSCITGPDAEVNVRVDGQLVLNDAMVALRDAWEETSFRLEQQQTNHHCVDQEESGLKWRKEPPYHLSFDPNKAYCLHTIVSEQRGPDVAILREEGSNGDREMAAAFHAVGFQTWDVNMEDLCSGKITLDRFRGVAFVGGFSYADVCGSGKGWAATALFNSSVKKQFARFYQRNDTFSLGVCNGCQLMALLGWVVPDDAGSGEGSFVQGLFLDHNLSEKFESRFVTVKISKSPALMFSGMEGTVFGITLAHGEGRMVFKNQYLHEIITKNNLVPMHYVDDNGKPTCQYPFNPNGSPDGIAAVCSHNGRHLAIMPHPERCFLPWQCPWMPYAMQQKLTASPWLQMFKNAHEWCT